MAPGTNNGAESCVKNTRADAGNVVGSVGETLAFLLQQVEHVSSNEYHVEADRPIPAKQWHKASSFRNLFGTNKIRHIRHQQSTFYCCSPRADPDDEDVCNREDISQQHAGKMVEAFCKQRQGGDTTVQQLSKFSGPFGVRILGLDNNVFFCTCPAFCGLKQCFHTIGLAVFLGKMTMPETLDATPVVLAARGNKRKAPPRGAVPLLADQKDVRIRQLEAQIRQLKRPRGEDEDAVATQAVVDPVVDATRQPTRRLRRKTACEEASVVVPVEVEVSGSTPNATAAPQTPQAPQRPESWAP
jgi:hypothetical protein